MNEQVKVSNETQAFKTTRIFMGGILVGAAFVAVVTQGFQLRREQVTQTAQSEPKQVAQAPAPTPQPLTISGRIDKLGRELYTQGISISSKVGKVYPGAGFIVEDFSGTKLFVQWGGDSPEKGKEIAIKGPLVKVTREKLAELSQDKTFSKELLNFLNGQKIIIEARQINPTNL